MYVFTLGTYDGIETVILELLTEIIMGGNLECLLLGDRFGYLDELDLSTNVGNELVFSNGKVLGRTHGDLVGV